MKLQKTKYGNIDITKELPTGYMHISGKRLTLICQKLGISDDYYAPALTGWGGTSKWPKPIIDGVVVKYKDAMDVIWMMEESNSEEMIEKRSEAKARKQEKETDDFIERIKAEFPNMPEEDVYECAAHATEIGSGRVGRSSTCENPIRAAVVAYARHNYTHYDDCLDSGYNRQDARSDIRDNLTEIIKKWTTNTVAA